MAKDTEKKAFTMADFAKKFNKEYNNWLEKKNV